MLSTVMARTMRVVLVLLVALSIAYVLITPDQTDDIDGILGTAHPIKAQKLISASLSHSQSLTIVVLRLFTAHTFDQCLTMRELLDLGCVCRC